MNDEKKYLISEKCIQSLFNLIYSCKYGDVYNLATLLHNEINNQPKQKNDDKVDDKK